MKIPVGIGPSIDISIAGEDTLRIGKIPVNLHVKQQDGSFLKRAVICVKYV